MGNKKNKKNRRNNTHKCVYVKKKLPGRHKEKATQQQHREAEDEQEHSEQDGEMEQAHREQQQNGLTVRVGGSRIINLDKLQQYTDSLTEHSSTCHGSVTLSGESRYGIASVLTGHCTACQQDIQLETSKKVKGPKGYSRYVDNEGGAAGRGK